MRHACFLAVLLACFRDWRPYLQAGERGTVMVIAADRRQARVIMRYMRGMLGAAPMLSARIESERAAVKRAIMNAQDNEIENVYFFSGTVEENISKVRKAGRIVLDPPRAGVPVPVLEECARRLSPERIVYTSCEPATFFRDAAVLGNHGYRLTALTLADMFPQTWHLEVIGQFERV